MKQYLLSIYQPDGEVSAARGARASDARHQCARGRNQGGRRLGLQWRPASTEHCTVVRVQRGEVLDDRRSVRRGEGAHRRVPDRQGAGSRRCARVGAKGCARARDRRGRVARTGSRSRSGRSREKRDRGDRACLPRGVRACRGGPGARLPRHQCGRGSRPGRVCRGNGALAVGRAFLQARPGGSSPPREIAPSIVFVAKPRGPSGRRRPHGSGTRMHRRWCPVQTI